MNAVAGGDANWDERDDAGAGGGQALDEDRGRGDAVDVEVAVGGDELAALERAPNTVDGAVHAEQRERIVQGVLHEEGADRLRSGEAACVEHLNRYRMKVRQ